MEDHDGENENANFSVKRLKVNLKNTLKQSGVLSTVKAQIRQEFINGLTTRNRSNVALALNMNDRILYSSVYHLLRNRHLVNSISVFSAESGLDPKLSLISEDDIVKMIRFNGMNNTYKYMRDRICGSPSTSDSVEPSILDVMMQFYLSAGEGTKEISVQTESGGPSAREILDDRIHELRRTYQVSKEAQGMNPNKTIEERMVAFQRECETRLARDLEIQVTHIRENELARVRLEEQSRAHEEMENMRKRLEFEYAKRLQAHIEVESDSAKRLVDQEHAMQRALYENRQFMQREIDELRSRESAANRRAELEAQGIRALEHRLKESLCMIESREVDLMRREKAVEEARKGYQDVAHREALARVQSELDILSRERSSLMIEKQHFADEVGAQKALVSSVLALKAQLKAQSEELICKEEEVLAMQRAAQRLQLQREEEDLQIRKMLDQIDPTLATFSRCEQIVALIQQKADLQVQLANFRDAHLLQQKMEKMEQEMAALQSELRESRVQLESQAQQTALQKEHLERAVLAERAKVASQVHKLDELRQLLHDKTLTVGSLRRQLEGSASGGSTTHNNVHYCASGSNRESLGKGQSHPSQQRAHMSVTDQRAIDFLRRNGNYADAERAQGYPSTADPALGVAPISASASSALIDNVIQRLLLEQLQGQAQRNNTVVGSGVGGATAAVGNGAVMAVPPVAQNVPVLAVPAPTTSDAALQAQQEAATLAVSQRQQASELNQLTHTLQQEQLKAAEMKTQIEFQKLEQERLAWSLQREKLEAQQRLRELKESEESAVREREKEREREKDRERERQKQITREQEIETKATSATPAPASTEYASVKTTHSVPVSESVSSYSKQMELNDNVGREHETTSLGNQNQSDTRDAVSAEEPPRGTQAQAEVEARREAAEAAEASTQALKASQMQAEQAEKEAAAAEARIIEQRERLAAQERELERQRREADEWEHKQQQREAEKVAAATEAAAMKTKEEQRLKEEQEEQERQRAAQILREQEEQAARELKAQEEAQQEAERAAREQKEKEEQELRDAENRRLQEEQVEKERQEQEEKENEALNNSALLRQAETARIAQEEAERVAAEEAARAEAQEQARLKQEEDEKEIMAARQRVLQRRRAAAERNNRMTSSLPTSLQAAAAHSGETESASTSQNQSALSHLGSAMMPGVSTSLDSFAPGGANARSAPNKNLFPSSFQNLQDSDSSSDRMEVGDMSEEQDSSGMF